MNNRSNLKFLLLFLLIIVGSYLFVHFDLHIIFADREKLIKFINSFHPYDELALIALQILQVVFAPIPGEVTGFIGGYLYGPVLGTIYSTVGLVIGSWLAFLLARFLGLPFVEKAVRPELLQKYDFILEHQGGIVAFVLFLIPGFPKDFLCYVMGLSHMRMGTFLVISTVGRLFGTTLLSMSGSCARHNQYATLLVLLGVSGVFILLAYLYREKLIEMLKHIKKA